uniref:Uncharacterized protein n=1 Tax=Rhizophora mucronata TaxID=61149 RepID=A0A2P2Q821_RHIMU
MPKKKFQQEKKKNLLFKPTYLYHKDVIQKQRLHISLSHSSCYQP